MSMLLALMLQVGPNPNAGSIQGTPDELINRPPRETAIEAQSDESSQWLSECLKLAEQDPARAHSQAQIKKWETRGPDRIAANHCLGIAATELGKWDDARTAFLDARDETDMGDLRVRARYGVMAANAQLAGGNPLGALSIFTTARKEARASASATLEALVAIDSARALVALDRSQEALTELETATQLEPANAEGWLLRATLLRRMDRLDDAQVAIEQAASLAPLEVDIGLEAGVIAVLSGREEAARQSWQSVIETQPDSLAAQTAGDYLAQLGPETPEAGPDQ